MGRVSGKVAIVSGSTAGIGLGISQALAESGATLAADLRQEIHEKMQQGQSDQQILSYLISRYGDFILYRPPFSASTWLLWFGPLLFLITGLGFLIRYIRRTPGHTKP